MDLRYITVPDRLFRPTKRSHANLITRASWPKPQRSVNRLHGLVQDSKEFGDDCVKSDLV
jgi:hypothetical protein